MKGLKTTMRNLFFPKQDEYTELKTQLQKLKKDLQFAIDRNRLNSSRLLDLRRRYCSILQTKKELPVQTQKKLQEKIDKFLEQYKEYRFEEPIQRSRDNLEMQTTNYNFTPRVQARTAKQATFQTIYNGKWEKPVSEQVSCSKETNATPNSTLDTQRVYQGNDVEMKDAAERNQEDIVHQNVGRREEYKNQSSALQQNQKDEDSDGSFRQQAGLGRGSNGGKVEIFQQNEDRQTQTTPGLHKQRTTKANFTLEDKFQNLHTFSDVSMKDKIAEKVENDIKQKNFTSFNQGVEYDKHKTRSSQQNEAKYYKETHTQLGGRRSSETASSRIERSVLQSRGMVFPEKSGSQYGRFSVDQYHQGLDSSSGGKDIYSQYGYRYEKEEDVRIQVEEDKYNNYTEKGKVIKCISDDKNRKSTEEVNRRHIHGHQPKQTKAFSTGVLVIERDGIKSMIHQPSERKETGGRSFDQDQHRYRLSTEQKEEGEFNKSDQSSVHFCDNKDTALKNVQALETPQETRGWGNAMLNKTFSEYGMKEPTRNYHQHQNNSSVDKQRRSPSVAQPVHQDHRRTEKIEVATEAVEEPLQILDVHKLFQDNFDFKSLDAMDAVTQIEMVQEWARSFEEQVSNFSEAKFSLEYFVLDEKLMRFIEHLDKLRCREDQVATQKKIKAIEFIKGLHKTLDSRATDE